MGLLPIGEDTAMRNNTLNETGGIPKRNSIDLTPPD